MQLPIWRRKSFVLRSTTVRSLPSIALIHLFACCSGATGIVCGTICQATYNIVHCQATYNIVQRAEGPPAKRAHSQPPGKSSLDALGMNEESWRNEKSISYRTAPWLHTHGKTKPHGRHYVPTFGALASSAEKLSLTPTSANNSATILAVS